ncbi:MAG: class I adenylate-forming enzyme family protein [Gemmatimonadota bacterium]
MDSSISSPAATAGLAGLFQARAAEHPDAEFLRFGDHSRSYAEVDEDVRSLAAAWQDLGVEAGDRIVVSLPNRPEAVVAVLAAARLGAPVVPVSHQSSARDLRFVLRNTEATIAVIPERLGDTDYLQLYERLLPELPALQYLATVGEEDLWYDDRIFQFEDLVSAGRGLELADVRIAPSDDAAILYTAGTSHKQKGVILSHGNLLFTGTATAEALGLGPDDVTLCVVPLSNIFGIGATLIPTIATGGGLVLQEVFDDDGALGLIERHRPTVLHGVPTIFVLLRRELAARGDGMPGRAGVDVSSLRTGIVAGAPTRAELVDALRRDLVPELEIAYGLTETSSTVTITTPDSGPARSSSVGTPLVGVEVVVLDADERPRPTGEVGDIAVRGPNVMTGYFRQPAATRAAFTAEGFLRTGDLGRIDAAGNLHIVGRESDVIIRGGYGVHPREIEDHLRSHPAVDEVVVVGLPNEVLGELICACIVPVEGALVSEDEIREHCRPALAEYKLPDIVRFLEDVPRSEGGAPLRAEVARAVRLREAAADTGDEASERRAPSN